MTKGLWVWPADQRGQWKTLRKVSDSPHLMAALLALTKNKDGVSNAELPDALNDSSEWTTLWVVRQLMSLGFVEQKLDFFGNAGKYQLTELGRSAYATITGQVAPPKPSAPGPATLPPAAPKVA
jgi:hypothetical protein